MPGDVKRKKRRDDRPGLIEEFIADPIRKTMSIKLYRREIRRLQLQFPEVAITQDSQFNNTDLWECTINKK